MKTLVVKWVGSLAKFIVMIQDRIVQNWKLNKIDKEKIEIVYKKDSEEVIYTFRQKNDNIYITGITPQHKDQLDTTEIPFYINILKEDILSWFFDKKSIKEELISDI